MSLQLRVIFLAAIFCLPAMFTEVVAQDCALEPQLDAPGEATVVSSAPLNGRNKPSLDGFVMRVIQPQSSVAVLEGPECADGYNWYKVESSEITTWVAEGGNGVYWLSSVPATTEPAPGTHHRIDYYACSASDTWFKLVLLPWDLADTDYHEVTLDARDGAVFNHVLAVPETQTADEIEAWALRQIPVMWIENIVGLVPGVSLLYEFLSTLRAGSQVELEQMTEENLKEAMAEGEVRFVVKGDSQEEVRFVVQASHPEGGGITLRYELMAYDEDDAVWTSQFLDTTPFPGERVC